MNPGLSALGHFAFICLSAHGVVKSLYKGKWAMTDSILLKEKECEVMMDPKSP